MNNLNEELLMSIDNIETTVCESEMNVCMEMVSGYTKICNILEYAEDDMDISVVDSFFMEADASVAAPADNTTNNTSEKKDEKKAKGIKGLFKKIINAIKSLAKFISSQFKGTTRIVKNLLMDEAYRDMFKFNKENKGKYNDMSMTGIPPLEDNTPDEPVAEEESKAEPEKEPTAEPAKSEPKQAEPKTDNKQGSSPEEASKKPATEPKKEEEKKPEPSTGGKLNFKSTLYDPITIYAIIAHYTQKVEEATKNKDFEAISEIAEINNITQNMKTIYVFGNSHKDQFAKLNKHIKFEKLTDMQKKYLKDYDKSRMSLYNFTGDLQDILDKLGDAFMHYEFKVVNPVATNTAEQISNLQHIDNVNKGIARLQKYITKNASEIRKIVEACNKERTSSKG